VSGLHGIWPSDSHRRHVPVTPLKSGPARESRLSLILNIAVGNAPWPGPTPTCGVFRRLSSRPLNVTAWSPHWLIGVCRHKPYKYCYMLTAFSHQHALNWYSDQYLITEMKDPRRSAISEANLADYLALLYVLFHMDLALCLGNYTVRPWVAWGIQYVVIPMVYRSLANPVGT